MASLPATRTSSLPPVSPAGEDQAAFFDSLPSPTNEEGGSSPLALHLIQMEIAAEGARTAVDMAKFGDMYHAGDGVPRDEAKAFKYWKRAALNGHAPSQYRVGVAYRDGVGIPEPDQGTNVLRLLLSTVGCTEVSLEDEPGQSFDVALRWFELAADQNEILALIACGDAHYHGIGTYQDSVAAFEFYSRAVDSEPEYTRPVMDASLRMAALLRKGDGVTRNLLRAHNLYHEAAKSVVNAAEDPGWAKLSRMAMVSATELKDEIEAKCPLLGKRIEVSVAQGKAMYGNDRNTQNILSIEGQQGTVVNYDEAFKKYVVEFDITPGQFAKVQDRWLKVLPDDSNNAKTRRRMSMQESLAAITEALEKARQEGASSPATKDIEHRRRAGL